MITVMIKFTTTVYNADNILFSYLLFPVNHPVHLRRLLGAPVTISLTLMTFCSKKMTLRYE